MATVETASGPTGASTQGTVVSQTTSTETRTRTISQLVDDVSFGRIESGEIVESSLQLAARFERLHAETFTLLLRQTTSSRAKQPIEDLLTELADLGFPWSDVASIVGVSVPALRKWRKGGDAIGDNRVRLAELVAFCDIIQEKRFAITDIVGWLATPLVSGRCPITGLDLLRQGRYGLMFQFAETDDPESILDEFDPDWRARYDDAFEVFVASDGVPAVRFRHGD